MAWSEGFTCPCMSCRLPPPFCEYLISPATINIIITFNFLNVCLYFPQL